MPLRLCRLGALLTTLGLAAPALGQTVHAFGATYKVNQDAASLPPTTSSVSISAAKNEFESFQIAVKGPANDVSLSAATLTGPRGAKLDPTTPGHSGQIMVYLEAVLSISSNLSDAAAQPGTIPDALIPQVDEFDLQPRNAAVTSIASDQYRVFWVDVYVPMNAAAGSYRGTFRVNWAGGGASVPVSLEVWDFSLPSTPTLKTFYGFDFVAPVNQFGISCCGASHQALIQRYSILGLNNRISITDWDDGNGFSNGFAAYDSIYGSIINGQANTILPGARPTMIKFKGHREDPAEYRAWHDHFQQMGWLDRLFADVADEPGIRHDTWCDLQTYSTYAHNAGINALTTTNIMAAQAQSCDGKPINLGFIDILVPLVDTVEPAKGGSTRGNYDSWLAGTAKEVWQTQSCDTNGCGTGHGVGYPDLPDPRWPSVMIDHTAIRSRALEWISFRNKITGEYYWDTTNSFQPSSNDPWRSQWVVRPNGYGNGDGTLVYPGTPAAIGGSSAIPVASIRLKMIREGIEDYEYMHILDSFCDRDYAVDQISKVFPTASKTDADPAALYAARQNLANRILHDKDRKSSGGACPR